MRFLGSNSRNSIRLNKKTTSNNSWLALLQHPLMVVVLTVLALFYYLSLDRSAQKATTSSQTVAVLEQEIEKMASNVSVLEKQLEAASHPVSQEKVIRNELLLQKSGEYVIQMPTIQVPEPTPLPEEKKTPWQEWRALLF